MPISDEEAVTFMEATLVRVLTEVDALALSKSDKARMTECLAQGLLRWNLKAVFNASDELMDTIDDEIDEFMQALVNKVRRLTN